MNAEQLLAQYERVVEAPGALVRLRGFVLDIAVRGKLVPQSDDDEPAEALLLRIASEKSRRVKAGEVRQPKSLPSPEAAPCELPHSWRWSCMAEIGFISPRAEADDDTQASFVPMPMIAAELGVAHQHEPRAWGEIKKGYTHFAEGDVGLAKITPCFENGKSTVFRNLTGGIGSGTTELHVVRPVLVLPDYVLLFFKSSHFIETGIPRMTGTAGQKRVPAEYFAYSPFPLPPLAEQRRIVAKVDELMSLCDQLEASLSRGENARSRLLDALLHETLQPSHDNVVDFDAARKRLLEKRQAVGCRIVERLSRTKGFGRTRAVKPFYWAEAHCGIALGGRWGRGNFGPYDQWIMSFESDAVSADWFSCIEHPTPDGSSWIEYKPGSQLTARAKMSAQVLDKQAAEFERVLTLLAGLDTDQTEIVTTLFAAWNDLLIEGKPVSDSIVITEMREHWHPSKGRFTSAQLQPWLDWLRQNDLVPKGLGPCTRHQTELL